MIAQLATTSAPSCSLLFSYPELKHGLTNDGIPQVNLDQINNQLLLCPYDNAILHNMPQGSCYSHQFVQDVTDDADVLNCVTQVSKLTRGKLHKHNDWPDWQASEYLQLDQCETRSCLASLSVHPLRRPFSTLFGPTSKRFSTIKKGSMHCRRFST